MIHDTYCAEQTSDTVIIPASNSEFGVGSKKVEMLRVNTSRDVTAFFVPEHDMVKLNTENRVGNVLANRKQTRPLAHVEKVHDNTQWTCHNVTL